MQTTISECKMCGKIRTIINKKYQLCQQCNGLRLSDQNIKNNVVNQPQHWRTRPVYLKKQSRKQNKIANLIRQAYRQIDDTRDQVCESCGATACGLDHSHTISRKRSVELGLIELQYNVSNIVLECRTCHLIWGNATWAEKSQLLSWDQKLSLIKQYDHQTYIKIKHELNY